MPGNSRQGRQRRVIGDKAGGEDQRPLAAVQIGKLALQQHMDMAVTGDVAGAAGARADRPQRLLHRFEDRRMLPHAEIVVRTPHRDLCADAVVEGARKAAAAPLEIGKDAVATLGAQPVELPLEKAFVVHRKMRLIPVDRCWSRRREAAPSHPNEARSHRRDPEQRQA
jgi:hypothetical protein